MEPFDIRSSYQSDSIRMVAEPGLSNKFMKII